MRDVNSHGFDFRFIQNGIKRTFRFCRILRRFNGVDAAFQPRQLHDFAGEVVPTAHALVRKVISFLCAVFDLGQQIDDCPRQIGSVRRRADLVKNDVQTVAFRPQAAHRFDKVVAERAVQPSRADNRAGVRRGFQRLFSVALGQTIYADGIGRVRFDIRAMPQTVENVIGRDMDDFRPRLAQIRNAVHVDRAAFFGFVLRLVHGGVGGAVHNRVDAVFVDKAFNRLLIRDVQIGHVNPQSVGQQSFQLRSQLTVRPCNQKHVLKSLNNGWSLSFSDKTRSSAGICQSIPKSGSLQSIPPSDSLQYRLSHLYANTAVLLKTEKP